jgi:hypothetical protein
MRAPNGYHPQITEIGHNVRILLGKIGTIWDRCDGLVRRKSRHGPSAPPTHLAFAIARWVFWLVATVQGSFGMCFATLMLLGAPCGGRVIVHLGIAMLFLWASKKTPA